MANKMLIDATHPEETRVVVLRGNRVEEFDFEAASRKQLRGNIYLAKVTRVEPSLQAAFVDYGGNRHGFLAFSEIHPDYYQIPVADRQALLEEERLRRGADDDFEPADETTDDAELEEIEDAEAYEVEEVSGGELGNAVEEQFPPEGRDPTDDADEDPDRRGPERSLAAAGDDDAVISGEPPLTGSDPAVSDADEGDETASDDAGPGEAVVADAAEPVTEERSRKKDGGEARKPRRKRARAKKSDDEAPAQEAAPRKPRRQYKIQEVIKRRQILLVQVVKEERGTKGAALTTYLSLAGRYSVLMPNSARGGGISRKITNPTDRKRLKQIAGELPVPEGMGVILRTAGASRTKTEIKRDFEYLMRLWENVRDLTLKSSAPTLVYEEGNLVKRSIRDLYNKDIDEVLVAGETGYREAKDFMRMLMPSHAKNVQPYRDKVPIFAKHRVEPQLDAMFLPQVTLPSGGYVVINQTEALVAVDVNSGKATREHNIEDTALRTNVEAAEEIARQLRLRDLAGLIVIDFIDMEEKRNNRTVERKLKDCLKTDRARIQVGRISHFGLLEMSRQRLRTGVLESSTELCPHCHGTGVIRSTESVALHVLRTIEDQLLRNASHNLNVRIRTDVALYIINHKRHSLNDIEDRYGIQLTLVADETIEEAYCIIERNGLAEARRPQAGAGPAETIQPDSIELDDVAEAEETSEEESDEGRRKRRRKRRRRGRDSDGEGRSEFADESRHQEAAEGDEDEEESDEGEAAGARPDGEDRDDSGSRKRRRGRRGGRRNKRTAGSQDEASAAGDESAPGAVAEAATDGGAERVETAHEPGEPDDAAPEQATATREEAPAAGAEAAVEPESEREPEAAKPAEEAAPVSEATTGASEPPAEPEQPAEPELPAEEAEEEEPRPKRSGWWQRRGFFRPE